MVRVHNTKILLLTPPPVNEYQLEPNNPANDSVDPRRLAAHTKLYADACRDVGTSLGVPVVDIWTAFMNAAGWTEGQPLAGSKDALRNEVLETLLVDGGCRLFKQPPNPFRLPFLLARNVARLN